MEAVNKYQKLNIKDQIYKSKIKNDFKRRLYNLVLAVIRLIDILPKDSLTRIISDQLIRSITSVIGNYVEGLAASSRKDYTNYFNNSLKSANESKLWLCLLRDSGKASSDRIEPLLKELDEISKILASSILTLKSRR